MYRTYNKVKIKECHGQSAEKVGKMKDIEIIKLHSEKKLTPHEISELTGLSIENIENLITDSGIKIPERRRKYRLLKASPLSQEQKDLIVGSILGSGALIGNDNQFRFTCGHLEEDIDLLHWKKIIMGNLTNVIVKHNKIQASFFRSVIHHELNIFAKLLYNNNKKIVPTNIANFISPLSLAVLTSDLGWINKTFNIRLQTTRYTYDENVLLEHVIKIYGINSKICEFERNDIKYYFISMNKRNSLLFYNLIKQFYPKPLRDYCPATSQRLYA